MNLIANTGIQLFTFSLEVNLNDTFKMYFHEWYDTEEKQLKLEIAHNFSEDEIWVRKHDLSYLGYAINGEVKDPWENIKDDFFAENKKIIPIQTEEPRDSGCFYESVNRIQWQKIENVWLPCPFFSLPGKKSEFGPTNWCRFKLTPVEKTGKVSRYNLLLAFDTKTIYEKEDFQDEDLNECPVFTNQYDNSKTFAVSNDEYSLLAFCSRFKNGQDRNGEPIYIDCDWVNNLLLKQFHNLNNINDFKGQKPKLEYLAQFIFILRYIQQLNVIPTITLYSNKNVEIGNVDLVVDIGNSRTCAVLFDDGDFTRMSPLEMQDFTNPVTKDKLNKYVDSFDMRLAFREADLGGKFGIENSRQFVYPSLVRLGKEATNLIHKATNLNTGAEKTSTFSSPKRFLWDTLPQKQEWEFVLLEGDIAKPLYIEGISEQLNDDGSVKTEGDGGILMKYSKKALMTFAFLEILSQANMQINSYEQRKHWGNESKPRKLRKIIVTCPTAMSRVEQMGLRKSAEDASIMLERFYNGTFRDSLENDQVLKGMQVIPASRNLSLGQERREWIFDEATAAQFVFLYAEIKERYLKNAQEYFEFYGKVRDDLNNSGNKTLTIGSVDIGAGTTDVMIASYTYNINAGRCTLTPVPLFWESFYKAGDDLLKELVHQLVVEGKYSPIERKLQALGLSPNKIIDKNNDFFGGNTGMSHRNKQLRADFNIQVSVPVVLFYLNLLKEDKEESKILSYNDIFQDNFPTKDLLNHFKLHFGFELETIQWKYERKEVSAIVEKTFDDLIGKISSLFSFYKCDIVLLSGRPTSLKTITDLFLKYYAISPNRLKTMNDYRVGRWYPQDKRYKFVDGNGKFLNPKSIITTGAMIGQMASNGGFNGFSLDLQILKDKLLPTTKYFGVMNEQLFYLKTIISPDTNRNEIEVPFLPFRIGTRQIDTHSYPSRPFYVLDYNEVKIEDRVMGRLLNPNNSQAVYSGIDQEKEKIRKGMPLKVIITRDYNENIEQLSIEEILDKDGNILNKGFFRLQVQSMSELENFWLDSGIFSLNVNTSDK